tara:strand:+ start:1319 stop:1507 length:189 start_codon:yes stop_codon:yes gene_type:complete
MMRTLDCRLMRHTGEQLPQFDIDAVRAEIHALDKSIYMNTGGSGPLPNSVAQDIISAYQDVA